MKQLIIAIMMAAMASPYNSSAQGMAVNTSGAAADASAALDVSAANQGVLVPRMLSTVRTGISSPATGLLVYQTDAPAGFYYNSGTPGAPNWISLSTASNVTTQGNSFNGTSQLVQTNGSGQLPAISGANLTSLPAGNLTGALPAISGANLTNLNGANLTDNSVTIGKLPAGATNTTYLRGDGTWATPSGGGGSSVSLQLYADLNGSSTTTSQSVNTTIDLNYNHVTKSPSSGVGSYDGTTYTVGADGAGVYLVTACAPTQTSGTVIHAAALLLNNAVLEYGSSPSISTFTGAFYAGNPIITSVVSLVPGDKLKVQCYLPSGAAAMTFVTAGAMKFTITKLN